MLSRILAFFGITYDVVSREEAAREIMGRPVRFAWHPVIVEEKREP